MNILSFIKDNKKNITIFIIMFIVIIMFGIMYNIKSNELEKAIKPKILLNSFDKEKNYLKIKEENLLNKIGILNEELNKIQNELIPIVEMKIICGRIALYDDTLDCNKEEIYLNLPL